MRKIERAIISASNKTGVVLFAQELSKLFKVKIFSTGGTAKVLRENRVSVIDISDYTV